MTVRRFLNTVFLISVLRDFAVKEMHKYPQRSSLVVCCYQDCCHSQRENSFCHLCYGSESFLTVPSYVEMYPWRSSFTFTGALCPSGKYVCSLHLQSAQTRFIQQSVVTILCHMPRMARICCWACLNGSQKLLFIHIDNEVWMSIDGDQYLLSFVLWAGCIISVCVCVWVGAIYL